ncbi:hypothetical protein PIIN_11327 [Serendipita indica DSM 11827]|uniref:Uncharacterized protein n=1 Tax=Serendipita indica (strain DSM 11827) TaxID=1109443 RepID=G4U1A7_SERID|nr:hypothetical protein PIIN_11327 [Serendipita indica DSM 11827]
MHCRAQILSYHWRQQQRFFSQILTRAP